MDSILNAFNISFLLRNAFSGIFFVIAYYVASHNPQEFSKIDLTTLLSVGLPVALFAGVTAYGILRSLLYPFIEYFFGSNCGKAWRQSIPLISASTIGMLLWRWGQDNEATTFDRDRIKEINEHLNVWSDLIYLQYNSALCIALGAWVGAVIDPGRHCPYFPLIVLAVLLLLAAFVSNWRHHSVLDRIRNPTSGLQDVA
jgi:hypothetical protein